MLGVRRFFSFKFEFGICSLVGPGKKKGEDAYWGSSDLLTVADGVGGWTLSGIDPSKYAWELVNNIQKAKSLPHNSTALEILHSASSKCTETGSSTCILMVLDSVSGVVDTINVGDSGFYLYRKAENRLELINKSQEVLHGFNFPFQLGTEGDSPNTGNKKKVKVQNEDLIVLYSDGLSDNLFEDRVREMLEAGGGKGSGLEEMAKELANEAIRVSADNSYLSPFAKTASLYYMQKYLGGKPDDTTVIVARVLGE